MISGEELETTSRIRKTNLFYEEKEYFQHVFLHAISRHGQEFIFKGGTCLRICHGLERASEDLDFSTGNNIGKTRKAMKGSLKDFELLNIPFEKLTEKEFEGNIRFEARFRGPLYTGIKQSTNTVKIDFNRNRAIHIAAAVVPRLFSDIPAFTLAVMGREEILAEKIRALAQRSQPRDLYDIWFLLSQKTELDPELVRKKFAEGNVPIHGIKMPSESEYITSLKGLLSWLPPYRQVIKEAKNALENSGFNLNQD